MRAVRGTRLGAILHRDDALRELAYDRDSPVARLARELDEAGKRDWLVIGMQGDWRVFPGPR